MDYQQFGVVLKRPFAGAPNDVLAPAGIRDPRYHRRAGRSHKPAGLEHFFGHRLQGSVHPGPSEGTERLEVGYPEVICQCASDPVGRVHLSVGDTPTEGIGG